MQRIIKLKSIGLMIKTEVVCNDRTLVTQGLSLDRLCELWRWYFNIAPFDDVIIETDTKTYNSLLQRSTLATKSVLELFEYQGFKVKEIEDDNS